MKRQFFALWPDADLRQQCLQIMQNIPISLARPVTPANLHVTLQFLGQVNPDQEQALLAAAETLCISPMSLLFDQLNYWRKPGILCLSSHNYDNQVSILAAQLAAIAQDNGIQLDQQPFRPHITLARKAHAALAIEFSPISWIDHGFCLVESCSGNDGVVYKVIQRWELTTVPNS
ncbi:RNA 2',3'-cyclic phosphodiesterase [Methylomonas paludis]|uniref:RNA 2',3'-cyclic phosphodiesterase n=1 Tax=Methylomonas paludis TaxID=1173101 RepID=A0A975MN59_9GAMM|nr:RNA 2',3'-cyclic phosphodiesterase [Methylomonas paludis]QWF70855.1 RNA 2',3'-cyclic phosphodiesterase [Methylomonas paludis]